MKKHLFSIIALLFIFSLSQAQEYGDKNFYLVDSLDLSILTEGDRILVDTTLEHYHAATLDSTKLWHVLGIVDLCWSDDLVAIYTACLKELTDSLLARNITEEELAMLNGFKASYLGYEGYVADVEGDMDKALSSYIEAYEVYKELDRKTNMATQLARMSVIYQNKGNTTLAIEKCIASNDLLEEGEMEWVQSRNYKTIADILKNNNSFKEADKYYTLAKKHALLDEDDSFLGYIYNSKANMASNYLDYELGLLYCDTAIQYFEKVYYPQGIGYTYTNYATLLKKLGRDDESIAYSKKGLEIAREIGHRQLTHIGLMNMTEMELKLGMFEEAKIHGEEALLYIPITDNKEHAKITLTNLAQVYGATKEFEKGYKIQSDLLALKDSIYSDQKVQDAMRSSFDIEYENQKKIDDLETQQKLALAAAEKKRTQLGLIAAALIALIIAIAAYFIYGRLKIIEEQKIEIDEAYQQLEESKKNELAVSNLKALQSQMNPHFIFNALNSVQDLVLLQDIRNSNKYLGKFSDLIRKILLSSKEQFISLSEEIEILQLYLDLEKLRFGDEFVIDLQCSVPPEKQDEIELPAMFIQPYIENAIKHGLFHKVGVKKLEVHFKLLGDKLECVVADNGIGQEQATIFKKKRLHLHTGFSTEAINERIRLLNETLKDKIELDIQDLMEDGSPTGTRIVLLFPLEN